MPQTTCVVCHSKFSIRTEDWKYLLSSQPFICSVDCAFKWIRKGVQTIGVTPHRRWGATLLNHSNGFRSHLERMFYIEAEKQGFVIEHERWGFLVGNGTYTPDFYFPNFEVFVETKGKWGMSQKTKFTKFRAQYPSIPIIVLPWVSVPEEWYDTERV